MKLESGSSPRVKLERLSYESPPIKIESNSTPVKVKEEEEDTFEEGAESQFDDTNDDVSMTDPSKNFNESSMKMEEDSEEDIPLVSIIFIVR